jgi:plastocyanin
MRLNRILFFAIGFAALLLVSGCGSHAQKTPRPVGTVPYTATDHKGIIYGTLSFEGDVPEAKAINKSKDPHAAALYKDKPLFSEDLVVNNKALQNAVVYLTTGTEKWVYPNPPESVNVEIRSCRFVPRAVTVTAGQKVAFTNRDNFYSTVLGQALRVNPQFNLGLHTIGDTATVEFNEAELGYRVTSDIRKWMECYIHVFYHPFHTVTDANGKFELKHVPDGEYTLNVWHEHSDVKVPPPQTVTVKGGAVEQNFTLKLWANK